MLMKLPAFAIALVLQVFSSSTVLSPISQSSDTIYKPSLPQLEDVLATTIQPASSTQHIRTQ